jgi:hypothetical protein
MKGAVARYRVRALTLGLAIGLLAVAAAGPAEAGRFTPGPTIDIQSAASLEPDGSVMGLQLLASCPERWTVVEAVVAVSQPQASGRASFTFPCIGSLRPFSVVVPASAGTFELGEALATASLTIQRGRTEQVHDSQVLDVQPSVFVDLADTATLESGGGAVLLDITVACPAGATGTQSYVNVSQGQATSGNGNYVPICDGQEHTFTVRVQASQGVYQPGAAQALTFANVEHEGTGTAGIDEGAVQIVT